MRDEIMRLAERAADMLDGFEQALRRYAPIEDIEEWPYHPDITDTAAELRALARTDHVEDKLGMVAEDVAEEIVESIGQTVGVSHGGWDDVDEIELCRAFHAEFVTRGMLASAPAPTFGIVPIKPGNWPEDSSHENGNYECKCCHCGATFYGHKRRVTCKVCASPAPDHSAGVGGMFDIYEAYNGWPDDLRKKLSLHDLRRMNGWVPANAVDPMAERSRKLIVGFMLDCNAVGMVGAAENLGKAIKEAALAQPADADAEGGK